MKKFILIFFIFNIVFINIVFGENINKGCSGPMYTPFDRMILFDKFNAANAPKIKDYKLDEGKRNKLDNILSKISDDRKFIFLINIEKIFKNNLEFYSKNLKGFNEGGQKYYTDNEIKKIKLLYSLNFYFLDKYKKYDKLKESIVENDKLSLDNGINLKIVKVYNKFIPKVNCIQVYDGYNNIFESNNYNKDLIYDIKLINNNIFFISYKSVGNKKLNKNLVKIYNIGLGKPTIQQPFYFKIIDKNLDSTKFDNIIGDYIKKLNE